MHTTTRLTAALAAGAAALTLAACTPGAQAPVATIDADPDGVTAARPTPTPSPSPTPDGPLDLTAAQEMPSGLTIALTNFERATTGEWDIPESTPYLRFDVVVTNNGDHQRDLSMLTLSCTAGEEGRVAESVFAEGVDSMFEATALPGTTKTASFGCVVAEGVSPVQIEVSIFDDHRSEYAIFAGDVR